MTKKHTSAKSSSSQQGRSKYNKQTYINKRRRDLRDNKHDIINKELVNGMPPERDLRTPEEFEYDTTINLMLVRPANLMLVRPNIGQTGKPSDRQTIRPVNHQTAEPLHRQTASTPRLVYALPTNAPYIVSSYLFRPLVHYVGDKSLFLRLLYAPLTEH